MIQDAVTQPIQLQTREYRYERKFIAENMPEPQVRTLVKLHPSLFYEPYPPRFVNNLYLDSEGMDNYHDNVSGVGDRCKVRIRWYGELFGNILKPVLEFKIKRNLVGTKQSHPFSPFVLDERFSDRYFKGVLRTANLPRWSNYQLRDLFVVLLNRYYRRYYATRDGRYRVTIDTHMSFHKVNRLGNNFAHQQTNYRNIVVELKYGREHEVQARKVSSFFPFEVDKNSKYIEGIERVYF